MYPVSATFKDKIKATDRTFRLQAQIQHSQGTLDLTDADLYLDKLTFNEASQAGEDFTVGATVASDITLDIINKPAYAALTLLGATLTCNIGLEVSEGTFEYVPLGVFNVDEVLGTKASKSLTIKAVDNLILFDKPYSLSQLSYPATLSQIFLDLCSVCDVLPESVVFPNSNYVVQTRPEGDLTCRDVLGYVAELAGCFARATRTGKIELTWYTPSSLTLTGANRFDFTPRDDVVQITGVMATVDGTTYLAGSDEGSGGGDNFSQVDSGQDFLQGDLDDVALTPEGLSLQQIQISVTDSQCYELTSGTSLQGTVSATAGDMVLATVSIRDSNPLATPQGWTKIYETYVQRPDVGQPPQRLVFLCMRAESTGAVSFTATQTSAGRIYVNLMSLGGVRDIEALPGMTVVRTTGTGAALVPDKGAGEAIIWGCTAVLWSAQAPYGAWITLPDDLVRLSLDQALTQPRLANFIDLGTGAAVNRSFMPGTVGEYIAISAVRLLPAFPPSGVRISPSIDLSAVVAAAHSQITWSVTEPENTEVIVETALSLDGGDTWGAWQQATSGESIPGITTSTDLSNARLRYRTTLSTDDPDVTPILHSVTVQVAAAGGGPIPQYLVDLSDNPLLTGDYETAIGAVYAAVKDTAFHPFESSWQGNPAIQAGDMLTQVDRDGNEYPTLVTHSTYKYRGKSTLEARGLPVTAKGFKGSTNKKLAGIIRKVEQVLGDRLTSLQQATLNATELIANMLGGHVIIEDDAIYICDAETLEESTKIWKWGAGGFGYSDDGGETYTTAITADGTIVAALVASGLVTADMIQAGILQSQTGSTSIDLNTGRVNIQNKVYFDPTKGEYIFDGLLSAKAINALKGEIDVVVSYTTITQVLAAEKGNISELTVDQLDTSDMVQRYLNSDTSNVNFIRIYGQNFEIIEATVKDGAPTAQLLDRKQRPLYWLDAERTGVTTTVTAYPVMVYQYDIENRKKLVAKFEVDPQSGDAIPVMIWGAGDQNDRAKGYIVKDQTGFRLRYQKASGDWVELALGENGIEGTNAALTSLDIYSDGMISEYDDGTVYDWSWTKDGSGRITEITNNTTQKSATISWNAGAKP